MKILKIIFPLFLISILFIPKVNASGSYNFNVDNFDIINTYLTNHTGSTSQDFYDMLIENLNYEPLYDNYVCLFGLSGGVNCHSTDGEFKLFAGITGYGGRPSLQLLLPSGDRVQTSYSITYNNSGEYVSHTSSNSTLNYFASLALTNNSSNLRYIPFISNNSTILYDNSYPTGNTYYDSFSFNNLITYNVNDNVDLSDFAIGSNYVANVYDPFSYSFTCSLQPLGVVRNIKSFTYEVTGIGNALNVPLQGQFVFVGRGGTALYTNDYNIQVKEKNNEEIEGRYQFQCNDEDIGNGCMLKYEYNYIDDIDTSLTLQFIFTSMTGQLDYEYSFYSCNINNSNMNYTYIDNIGGNNQIVENPSLENSINDDNVTDSNNFLNDNIINNSAFNQDHGLTAIIQAPINFLQSLSSKTCSNIVIPIPYLGNATIPCMSSIYSSKFSELYNILKIIINGVLCYRMALSVVMIVKGAKDPDNDKIEVMDL